MACSHAGIALLSRTDAAAQLKTARDLFAQAGAAAGIAPADLRYISPHIVDALRDTAR